MLQEEIMRILNITQQMPEKTGSGVYFRNMAMEQLKLHHDVYVLYGHYDDDKRFPEEIKEYRFLFKEEIDMLLPGMSDCMPYETRTYGSMSEEEIESYLSYIRQIIKDTIDEVEPDIIFSHHLFFMTNEVVQIADVPVIALSHGTDLRQIKMHPRFLPYLNHLDKLAHICALTPGNKEEIINTFGLAESKVSITYAAYNPEIFYPNSALEGQITFVYAGKIDYAKGVFELEEAFRPLDHCHLDMIGNGDYDQMRKMWPLVNKNRNVTLYNVHDQKSLSDVMRDHHAFIFPSYYEGLGLIALEALATGLILITNELPNLMEFLPEAIKESPLVQVIPMPKLEGVDAIAKEARDEYVNVLREKIEETMSLVEQLNIKEEYIKIKPYLEQFTWHGLTQRILNIATQYI